MPEDALHAGFTYTTATVLRFLLFWRAVSARLQQKCYKKHIYSADGQIVIPRVSQAISRPGDEHTKIREHYILSHGDAEPKFHSCEVSKAEMYRGGGTDWSYAASNLEPSFFVPLLYVCPSSLHPPPPLREKKYRHLKSGRLYEIQFLGLSYWNEVQQQLLQPLSDLVPNWLFHIRGPCSLCSHRAGMLDSTAATKATIYQLWLHTFWSIAPLNCSHFIWAVGKLKGGHFSFFLAYISLPSHSPSTRPLNVLFPAFFI